MPKPEEDLAETFSPASDATAMTGEMDMASAELGERAVTSVSHGVYITITISIRIKAKVETCNEDGYLRRRQHSSWGGVDC